MGTTTNLNLKTINRTTDAGTKTVGAWIDDIAGETASNMTKIDTFAGNTANALNNKVPMTLQQGNAKGYSMANGSNTFIERFIGYIDASAAPTDSNWDIILGNVDMEGWIEIEIFGANMSSPTVNGRLVKRIPVKTNGSSISNGTGFYTIADPNISQKIMLSNLTYKSGNYVVTASLNGTGLYMFCVIVRVARALEVPNLEISTWTIGSRYTEAKTFVAPTVELASNAVTTDTAQTISGAKTITGNLIANGQTIYPYRLAYLANVDSDIQSQLNNKASLVSTGATRVLGTITLPANINAKCDIFLMSSAFQGQIEIELFSQINGSVTKKIVWNSTGTNDVGTQKLSWITCNDPLQDYVTMTDIRNNADGQGSFITVANKSSYGGSYYVIITLTASNAPSTITLNSFRIGSVYTNDTTVFPSLSTQLFGDSGVWQNLVVQNVQTTNGIFYRKTANLCFVQGDVKVATSQALSSTIIGTLPNGYRPLATSYRSGCPGAYTRSGGSATVNHEININPSNGYIVWSSSASIAASAGITFAFVFITN